MFNLGFSPEMYGHTAACRCPRFWNLASFYIAAQGHGSNAKFLSCLIRGICFHSDEL